MEVCVDSLQSAVNAVEGGAFRIELCAALSEGGLTPTPGLLRAVRRLVACPIMVMLRPRPDFTFTPAELDFLLFDITLLRTEGADGFVFGALTETGSIDTEACRRVVEASFPLPVTFHRAFDQCVDVQADPELALTRLADLGFSRVLTSGQARTAEQGIPLIQQLVKNSAGISVMPGGGITTQNLAKILEATRAQEFHASARTTRPINVLNSTVRMGSGEDSIRQETSVEIVAQMVQIYRNYCAREHQ